MISTLRPADFLTRDRLALLTGTGWHVRIYVAAAPFFRCANLRKRLVLLGFRDRAHCAAFVPPPATSAAPPPLSSVLQPLTLTTGRQYFIRPALYVPKPKQNRCPSTRDGPHVVGRGYAQGVRSFMSRTSTASEVGTSSAATAPDQPEPL